MRLVVESQKPRVMVIACCDSRAAPETIFDASPGELFVVRNVANSCPLMRQMVSATPPVPRLNLQCMNWECSILW